MSDKKSGHEQNISDEDRQFFLDEVSDVRPLKAEKRIETVKNKPKAKPRHIHQNVDEEFASETGQLSDPTDLRDVAVEDVLFFARPGIQQKLQKKLRRGELPIEEELDLHGYTVQEARSAIQDFLHECKRQGIRYIRIVHGKGYRSENKVPVIKTHVAYWLPQHPDVLAYASALPHDGGTGALYVLLKVVRK